MKYNEQYIVDQYTKGRTQKDIANELKTYNTTIRRILLRNRIKLRSNTEIQSFVKHNPFSSITSETEYWLGLLATDGCLTNGKIILEFKEDDVKLLKDYKKFLRSPVNILTSRHRSGKKLKRVQFRNKEVYKTLQKLGITERKSYTLNLNFPITYNVLRGIIDGDGYIRKSKTHEISICSASKNFADQINDFLNAEGFNPCKNTRKNLHFISLHRKQELIDLHEKLYKDAEYFLRRKYETMACRYGNISGIHS